MSKTPKLRFKEFSGDWEKKRLSEIASIKGGYAFKSKEFSNYKDNYQVIKMGNLYQNQLLLDRSPSYKKEISEKEKEYLLKSGDIIITLTGTVGKKDFGYSYMISDEKNLLLNQRLGLIRNKENISDNRFLKYIVLDKFFLDQFFESSVGGTGNQANVSTKNMEEFYVYMPKLEEQEKIASFFSLIDDKISLQGEKVEALKDYKRGMMQKIFSRELRFKDDEGRDYPEWEEKKLNQLGDTYTGLSGKTKENFGIGECKYVIYKNVFGNTIAKEDEVELVEINEGESQNKVIKGDLLFTTSSETPEEVGMVSCWNYDVEDLYLNSFCFGYRLFDLEQYSPIFIAYLLRSESYRRKISILGQGSTRYNISKNELMKMKIKVPVIEEQRKIVSLLLGIESKIEKEQEKLDSLNEYKKGLLQQMFV